MELTKNEQEILRVLRSLNPFEKVTISADRGGRPDHYIVERTHKVSLEAELKPIR